MQTCKKKSLSHQKIKVHLTPDQFRISSLGFDTTAFKISVKNDIFLDENHLAFPELSEISRERRAKFRYMKLENRSYRRRENSYGPE